MFLLFFFFFFNDTATTEIYTLSLHDALPISLLAPASRDEALAIARGAYSVESPVTDVSLVDGVRSEEHTSELQSHHDLV